MDSDRCPVYASFFGCMGCAIAIIFSCMGSAYGMAKSSIGITSMGVLHPDILIKSMMPVILASIISIYGLVISVLISSQLTEKLALYTAFVHLGAGLAVGLSGMSAGFAIGIIGDAGVRASAMQPRLFVGMVLILIFAEVLGLYGLIVALLMLANGNNDVTNCR